MTRDFEITFANNSDRDKAKSILDDLKLEKDNIKIFNEIDERDKSLFVTLTYPNEIKKNDKILNKRKLDLNLFEEVVFVAIKNGMHDSKGYVFCSSLSEIEVVKKPIHVSTLHNMILSYF